MITVRATAIPIPAATTTDVAVRMSREKNIPWDGTNEQRLRMYEGDGKTCNWVFKKFLTRTEQAIRNIYDIIVS
jgi:hypothetical protein